MTFVIVLIAWLTCSTIAGILINEYGRQCNISGSNWDEIIFVFFFWPLIVFALLLLFFLYIMLKSFSILTGHNKGK